MQYRGTSLEVHLDHLAHNYHYLRQLIPDDYLFIPMVKANAYGHGDVLVAEKLQKEGTKKLGIVTLEEAIKLRKNGITTELIVFCSFTSQGAKAILNYQLTPVLISLQQLDLLADLIPVDESWPVHLKFNTGMNRLGFSIHEVESLVTRLSQRPNLHVEGICSHFWNGEDANLADGHSAEQWRRLAMVQEFMGVPNEMVHLYNSASLLCRQQVSDSPIPKFLGARPGVALYGTTSDIRQLKIHPLRTVMSWKSEIIQLQYIKKGDIVSYQGRWQATRDSLIGVVSVGYADGYNRRHTNNGCMLVYGQRVPVIGTVCMDYTMVDLTNVDPPEPLKLPIPVQLIGDQSGAQLSSWEMAQQIGTIPYEIMTSISRRVPRVAVTDT